MITETQMKKAGVTIRDRKFTKSDGTIRWEYQVVDGRKIVSRHVMFVDARRAAEDWLKSETP